MAKIANFNLYFLVLTLLVIVRANTAHMKRDKRLISSDDDLISISVDSETIEVPGISDALILCILLMKYLLRNIV